MKKREITVIPPSKLLCDNRGLRKYRVGGYMKVICNGLPQDRRPLYHFFKDVVSHYPNWDLIDVFEDVTDEKAELITFQGIISALQAAREKR